MPIIYNGTTITNPEFNGTSLSKVIYNGTIVFISSVTQPNINITSISDTSVSWYVTNADDNSATIKTSLYNITDGIYVRQDATTYSVGSGSSTSTYTNAITFGKSYKIMAEAIVSEISSGIKEYSFAYWRVRWYSYDGSTILETNYVANNYSMAAKSISDRPGYNTLGWSLTSNQVILSFPRNITADVDFIQRYQLQSYTMYWYPYLASENKTSSASYGTYITSAPAMDTSKPGYTFTGWSPSIAGSGYYVTGSQSFYAQYQIIPTLNPPDLIIDHYTTSKTSSSAAVTLEISNSNGVAALASKISGSGSMSSITVPPYESQLRDITGLSSGTSYTFTIEFTSGGYNPASRNISLTTPVPTITGLQAYYNKSTQVLTVKYDQDVAHYVQLQSSVAGANSWTTITCSLPNGGSTGTSYDLTYLGYSSTTSIDIRARTTKTSCGGVTSGWMRINTVNTTWESGFYE